MVQKSNIKTDTKEETVNKTLQKAKVQALEVAMAQIEKRFGKGAIMKLGGKPIEKVDVIPTGALSLDIALGIGGIPKGRIIEIFGPEGSGKTTLALHILAECQKRGGYAAYIDAEHALDPKYAKAIGVDIDNLILSQPDYGEQALEIVETLIRSGGVDLIVVDSVAALTPKSELEGEMGDAQMGVQARLMSQAMRKLTAIASRSKCAIVFLNQIRMKIGVLFGNPETTTGGKALKFSSSIRIEIRGLEKVEGEGGNPVGNKVKVKVVKNKLAPPFRETTLFNRFGEGFDKTLSLIEAALMVGTVKKRGSWYLWGEKQLGQGLETVSNFLKQNPQIAEKIEIETRKMANLPM
uniref:Protein RecA n=1 Tax=candidate division CPR3 bacterium TaxID=2268181 RepID=A0A7C5UUC9_UNCC3